MSTPTDGLILLDSDDEDSPSPPKRGRGRRTTNRRKRNTATATSSRPQTTRAASTRSRQSQSSAPLRNANIVTINVGDISDSEEDAPELPEQQPVSVGVPSDSPIGIDVLAQVLGVADCTPLKTSETPTPVVSIVNEPETSQPVASTSSSASDLQTHSTSSRLAEVPDAISGTSQSVPNNDTDKDSSSNTVTISAAQPKKTVRRGLAKREAGLAAAALDVPGKVFHNTAVYTQCVPSGGATGLLQGHALTEQQCATGTSETASDSENFSEPEHYYRKAIAGENRSSQQEPIDLEQVKDDSKDCDGSIGANALEASMELRSPTPPPLLKGKRKSTAKEKRLNQKLSNALQALNNVKGTLEKLGKATPKLKGRGRQSGDVVFVEEEEAPVRKDMVVKVRYMSTVHRISMNLDEPLHMLTSRLSEIVADTEEHNLNLFLSDQVLELSDTPRSIGLSVADILDCHHIKASSGAESGSEDSISVVVQCHHSRAKTTISAHKRRPLKYMIQHYAKMMDLDAKSITLLLDGEKVDPNDSPCKLDMEDMDIVDVIVTR